MRAAGRQGGGGADGDAALRYTVPVHRPRRSFARSVRLGSCWPRRRRIPCVTKETLCVVLIGTT